MVRLHSQRSDHHLSFVRLMTKAYDNHSSSHLSTTQHSGIQPDISQSTTASTPPSLSTKILQTPKSPRVKTIAPQFVFYIMCTLASSIFPEEMIKKARLEMIETEFGGK
jgi:hypothetical protein